MSVGIVDTTVLVHYFRQNPAAQSWMAAQPLPLSIVTISWMEVMSGARNKAHQVASRQLLDQFELLYLTPSDQHWALLQLERLQFSHHVDMNDCLIASVAHRLQIPLYTHNLKHMLPLLGNLAIKSY
jgi:predicted nucleic acid-binding protein